MYVRTDHVLQQARFIIDYKYMSAEYQSTYSSAYHTMTTSTIRELTPINNTAVYLCMCTWLAGAAVKKVECRGGVGIWRRGFVKTQDPLSTDWHETQNITLWLIDRYYSAVTTAAVYNSISHYTRERVEKKVCMYVQYVMSMMWGWSSSFLLSPVRLCLSVGRRARPRRNCHRRRRHSCYCSACCELCYRSLNWSCKAKLLIEYVTTTQCSRLTTVNSGAYFSCGSIFLFIIPTVQDTW